VDTAGTIPAPGGQGALMEEDLLWACWIGQLECSLGQQQPIVMKGIRVAEGYSSSFLVHLIYVNILH
jgi:hypothetical protein